MLNNLEFDHADIFADLAAIERQFHHLVRTVPAFGPRDLAMSRTASSSACWRSAAGRRERLPARADRRLAACAARARTVQHSTLLQGGGVVGDVRWSLIGGTTRQ